MKRIVNFLLTAVITYCLMMWVLFGLAILIGVDAKANVDLGIVISSIVALGMAYLVYKKIQPAKYELAYEEKAAFIKKMENELQDLGFQPHRTSANRLKYRAFIWFSLIDPKINVRLKNKKAIIKGRKEDLDNLISKLNPRQAA